MRLLHSARRASATIALAACVFAFGYAQAQQPQEPLPQSPPQSQPPSDSLPGPTGPATQVDDQTIEKFAAAYQDVSDIQTKAVAAMHATNDPQEQQRIKNDAEKQARAAVESKGLAAEEFNRVAQLMLTDQQLRQKVLSKLHQPEHA
jgi:siroheme synthase (precorrin-2 oxidase/ferrochelatase)